MEENIARASRVLMVCTERYVTKANDGVGGVGYEKMIVTSDLLKRIGSNTVIPIVRQAGSVKLPTFLGSKFYIDLSTGDVFESGIDQLLRERLNAPLFAKPSLGNDPFMATRGTAQPNNPSRIDQFMQAVALVYERSGPDGYLDTAVIKEAMNTSKLFFDHALDRAAALNYVNLSPTRKYLWLQDIAREYLVKVLNWLSKREPN